MKHFSSKEIKKQKKKTMDIDYGILYMKIKANLHHLKQTSHAYIKNKFSFKFNFKNV